MKPERFLYLIRHGQTDWNVEQRVMGRLSIDLNGQGSDQIKSLAKYLSGKGVNHIYTSPLKRATSSAEILSKGLGVKYTIDPRITEVKFGKWEGRVLPELLDDPIYHEWRSFPSKVIIPDGETLLDVKRRALECVEEILSTPTNTDIAIISHSDIIKVILASYLELPLDEIHKLSISNGSLSTVRINGTIPCILTINATSHLPSLSNA